MINGECFQYFPSSITQLDLCYLESLKNEELGKLPSTIQDLYLYGNSNLTNECFNFLPTTLISLKIGDNQNKITNEKMEEWKKRNKVY